MCFNPYSYGMFTLFDVLLLLLFYWYILDFMYLDYYYIRLLLQPEDGTWVPKARRFIDLK